MKKIASFILALTIACGILVVSVGTIQPINIISWGMPAISINAVTTTATGTTFALISNPAAVITWTIDTTGTVTSQTVLLEGSLDNSVWITLDSSTSITDAARTFITSVPFIRARISAHGGGGGTTTVSVVAKGSPSSTSSIFSGGTVTGPILAADGTAAAPSYSFSSDSDNGMFLPSEANTIGFAGGGTESFRVTSAGARVSSLRVGVVSGAGSLLSFASPGTLRQRDGANAQTLEIYGIDDGANFERLIIDTNTGASSEIIQQQGGTGAARALRIGTSGSASFVIRTNGTDQYTVDTSGRLISTGTTFGSLGTPANGSFIYCSDCTIANPCAGAGTGAFAKRLNGVWVCN